MCITKHLVNLKDRISRAAAASGRSENDVSILAVSKRQNVDAVHAAYEAGLHSMGENYLQEALQKIPQCNASIEWHFIGQIQSNKTRAIAEHFHWAHTISSEKVARRLSAQRLEQLPPLNVCVQVCTDSNREHGGILPDEAADLCRVIGELPGLRLRGLMTIPHPTDSETEQRKPFRRLRELRDELSAQGITLDTLSMGMTNDLEAAIAEGSTLVRIGTALFGPRPE